MNLPVAKEGLWIILAAGVLCTAFAYAATLIWWPLALIFAVVWVWVLAFFRDPPRRGNFSSTELCGPADGTVTEITTLESHEGYDGRAVRIGIFLSLFNVHVNRSPCAGRVRSVTYKKGSFLDARHPESGSRNESNTLVIEPGTIPGPVIVRQVAGLVARRIICHARPGDQVACGERFGMIRFGSRTELIIPLLPGTEILVKVGDAVRAGITTMVRQPAGALSKSGESGASLVASQVPPPSDVAALRK